MNTGDLVKRLGMEVLQEGTHPEAPVTTVACCDLLSVAMGTLPRGCAWVTVMANVNALAVASFTGAACLILALDTDVTEEFLTAARKNGITVLRTGLPIFDAALKIRDTLNA